ncbi:hypothetical protein L6267_02930 [Candidatus Parcubacteria bacterium]|nr:hypothetical protein [Candidatus Parcubacteria bacterium]
MIYKIKFCFKDIKISGSNPWELHFWVENEDEKINERLKEDFVFRLNNDWIVSANKATFRGNYYWFIRGSMGYVNGNKKYYKTKSEISYHKKYFNEELIEKYPQIKEKDYEGKFNVGKGIMIINL